MPTQDFFSEPREQSEVKTAIVTKYLPAWTRIMFKRARRDKVAYIDLFAGPGQFKDGTKSTPLIVLEMAMQDADMREKLITIFNDRDNKAAKSLQQAIDSLPGIEKLKYAPEVFNFEIGDQIADMFQERHLVPTLLFVDPWGYKGLTLNLIGSILKDWGSECIFFFNYNRINMGLNNKWVREHMDALFGKKRADALRAKLEPATPHERELTIIEELVEALQNVGGEYVLPFRFRNWRGTRTSHHLIFVSKHVLGYEIMKEIMASESSSTDQGVPSFEYNPADKHYARLYGFFRPLDQLADMLLSEFAGQQLSMKEIYQKHHVGKPYIKKNYKEVLMKLEAKGRIIADPPADRRHKNTFADRVMVTFPQR